MIGLALIVVYQLMTGKINMNGLLHDGSDGDFSPGRLQLRVFTIGGAFYYFLLVLDNVEQATFREIPNELLLVLGGSNSFYLVSKAYSLFRDRFDSSLTHTHTQTQRGR
jgi:hypothetical protein